MPVASNEAIRDLVGVGAALGAILIYQHFLPSLADVRTAEPFDTDIESAERTALIASTGFVLVTAGLARSVEVFIVGGIGILVVDFAMKHANAVNPATGKMATPQSASMSTSFPVPDYSVQEEEAA